MPSIDELAKQMQTNMRDMAEAITNLEADVRRMQTLVVPTTYTRTASVTSSGWYRIANGFTGIYSTAIAQTGMGMAEFEVRYASSGGADFGTARFSVADHFSDLANVVIFDEGCSSYTSLDITAVRLLTHASWPSNAPYIEVFVSVTAATTYTLEVRKVGGYNWQTMTPVAGSIPAGYTATQYNFPTDNTWIAPTLLNSWTNFGGGFDVAGYRKTRDNIVIIRGLVGGGVVGTNIFVIPSGYRPTTGVMFSAMSNTGAGRFDIRNSGAVQHIGGGNTFYSISCMYYADI